MEPFGILQFLQSILPKTQTDDAPQNGQTAPQTNDPPPETTAQPSPSQEAIMRFMQAHESRAKRTKKR